MLQLFWWNNLFGEKKQEKLVSFGYTPCFMLLKTKTKKKQK